MIKESISKKQLREFGLLIGLGIPIVIGWVIPAIGGHIFRTWTLWIGIPSLILGVLKPFLLYYPYKGWMALGHTLGWFNSRIVLGLVFLIVLQPIAFIMKGFGYDPLRQSQRERRKTSFREIKKNHKIDLTRIF
tara:strand:- start:2617 stop:3018 length:402 start_codon:yes stop_codon:yes gene_type:complete